MTTEAPRNDDEHGVVLQFPPRKASKPHAFSNLARQDAVDAAQPVRGLGKFAHSGSEPDDFSHRMKMNALAGLVLIVLIGGGLWVVDMMTQMKKNQDCALSGRRNCAQISIPDGTR